MAGWSRVLLCVSTLGIASIACKTSNPKDDSVIMVNEAPPAPITGDEPAPAPHVDAQAAPSILAERLDRVRGGLRVLPPYRGPDPCKMALAGESPVAKACSDGGLRKAVDMMQTFVKRAAAEGIVFQCSDCHPDEDDLSKLAPEAEAEFRKLLFLARPAG